MTVNRRRGEIAAELDGKAYRLCLTLGALAESNPPMPPMISERWWSGFRTAACRPST